MALCMFSDSPGHGTGTLHRMPEVLPPLHSAAWEGLLWRMRERFIYDVRAVDPRVQASRVFITHPSQEAIIEQLRELHNGEVTPECDEVTGRQFALPRVWRWEHHLHLFWVIELPPSWTRRQFELQFAA